LSNTKSGDVGWLVGELQPPTQVRHTNAADAPGGENLRQAMSAASVEQERFRSR